MPKLPKLSGHEVIKALSKIGFTKVRQKGSHVLLTKETSIGKVGCVVPLHDEIKSGTLNGILKQAQVSRDDFIELL